MKRIKCPPPQALTQFPDAPEDIIQEAMALGAFTHDQAISALRAWRHCCHQWGIDGQHPNYLPLYAAFMSGFGAGISFEYHEVLAQKGTKN